MFMEILMGLCWGAMNLIEIKIFLGALMLNLETVMMLFPDIFSNKVKTFVFSHCLSSEILLKVQQGKLKFYRRS